MPQGAEGAQAGAWKLDEDARVEVVDVIFTTGVSESKKRRGILFLVQACPTNMDKSAGCSLVPTS